MTAIAPSGRGTFARLEPVDERVERVREEEREEERDEDAAKEVREEDDDDEPHEEHQLRAR